MADTKISALSAVSAVAGTNELAVNEAGTSKKATVTQVGAYLQTIGMPVVRHLGSNYTNATTTGTEVSSLSFNSVVAGTYHVKWILAMSSAATTTSPMFGVNYSGTATMFMAHARFPSAGVSAATGQIEGSVNATTGQVWAYAATVTESTTAPNLGPWTGVVTADENCMIHVESLMVVSDTGDIELWAASEVGTSTVTLKVGSCGMLTRMN
jgi:hypothetical protein